MNGPMDAPVCVGADRTVDCPECARDGEHSTVREHTGISMRPIRTFTDDDGLVHVHEPDRVQTRYQCSRGHQFMLEEAVACPACGWRTSV